jgi:uncharacterized protein
MADLPIHPRARRLVTDLHLQPHPEGGWYGEVFRSAGLIHADTFDGPRAYLTSIAFLLTDRDVSRWHRLRSDEVWHWYEGDPLELLMLGDHDAAPRRVRLGLLAGGSGPFAAVPAGTWQAARTLGTYTLVGCTVGPGFEFADFVLARNVPEAKERLTAMGEEVARLL